jgi:hypothetical protein
LLSWKKVGSDTWWYYDYNNTMLPAAGWEEMMVVVAVRVNENWLLLF